MFYGGKLKGMPAKLVSDDGNNIVIRPLAYCAEKDLIQYAELKNSQLFHVIYVALSLICSAK